MSEFDIEIIDLSWVDSTCGSCVFQRDKRCRRLPVVNNLTMKTAIAYYPVVEESTPACAEYLEA